MEPEDIDRLRKELTELPRNDVLYHGSLHPPRYTEVIKDGLRTDPGHNRVNQRVHWYLSNELGDVERIDLDYRK